MNWADSLKVALDKADRDCADHVSRIMFCPHDEGLEVVKTWLTFQNEPTGEFTITHYCKKCDGHLNP